MQPQVPWMLTGNVWSANEFPLAQLLLDVDGGPPNASAKSLNIDRSPVN